jgi:hypothetical protein
MWWAASWVSFALAAIPGLLLFQSIAIRDNFGKVSLSSSSRLGHSSGANKDIPVMFPPGRARLATSPTPIGSLAAPKMMGIVFVASLAATVAGVDPVKNYVDLELNKLMGQFRETFVSIGPAVL